MARKRTILVWAANPTDTCQLRLGAEVRAIQEALRNRTDFKVAYSPATRIEDLQRTLLEEKPEVVHFCGHGAGLDGIVCEDDQGRMKLVPTEALADLLRHFKEHIKCVILNACFAEVQADAIENHIEHVIGMSDSVLDLTAVKFTEGFYEALGAGESFERCFTLGVNRIGLENIPEGAVVVLKTEGKTTVFRRPKPPPVARLWPLILWSLVCVGLGVLIGMSSNAQFMKRSLPRPRNDEVRPALVVEGSTSSKAQPAPTVDPSREVAERVRNLLDKAAFSGSKYTGPLVAASDPYDGRNFIAVGTTGVRQIVAHRAEDSKTAWTVGIHLEASCKIHIDDHESSVLVSTAQVEAWVRIEETKATIIRCVVKGMNPEIPWPLGNTIENGLEPSILAQLNKLSVYIPPYS